jgi:hypothetical protein
MNTIPFKIIEINTEKFVLGETPAVFDGNIDVNTNFSFGVNATNQLIRCVMNYTYLYKGKEILNMVLSCVFKIEEEAFGNMLQDGKFILEPFFSRYLATINVGAARGEIHARCEIQNSPLSKIILPPINLVEALPAPITIILNSLT